MFIALASCISVPAAASAQTGGGDDVEFGPVVRAYLAYLRNEQNVVDDRASRHEVSPAYFRRNSNRIRALRQMAVSIARESGNDYLPEMEAVAGNEFTILFERPPQPRGLRKGAVINNTFRFLGTVRAGEIFYVFARLNQYEQAELMRKPNAAMGDGASQSVAAPSTQTPRSIVAPSAAAGGANAPPRGAPPNGSPPNANRP